MQTTNVTVTFSQQQLSLLLLAVLQHLEEHIKRKKVGGTKDGKDVFRLDAGMGNIGLMTSAHGIYSIADLPFVRLVFVAVIHFEAIQGLPTQQCTAASACTATL